MNTFFKKLAFLLKHFLYSTSLLTPFLLIFYLKGLVKSIDDVSFFLFLYYVSYFSISTFLKFSSKKHDVKPTLHEKFELHQEE